MLLFLGIPIVLAAKIIHTEIEGQKLKLSNLDKIIYPSIGISKAEVIQYYLSVSDLILPHLSGRPLTVIRFPDGITKKGFYSKDKPEWTPEWINSLRIHHDDRAIDYIVAFNQADLVWLSNLACLELHPMQYKKSQLGVPDYFVFDLDPDENLDFDKVKECAYHLKEFLVGYDYQPLLKTSGGKGLHIIVPIKAQWDFEIMINTVKSLTRKFIAQHPKLYTLQMSKEKRRGKILIDIFRNHPTNTTVAPYSLRGKKGGPISMPMAWGELEDLITAQEYNITNYKEQITKENPWADWSNILADLHDQKAQIAVPRDFASDKRLDSYAQKRDFTNTNEPKPVVTTEDLKRYVLQLHDAQNLHYDLRLEHGGVLWSWAIPKGLPYKSGQKRLAIRTEDHPIKYLDFEGAIPKGEYGAGEMWIVDQGQITWVKNELTSLKFVLNGKFGKKKYQLYQTQNEEQWLMDSDEQNKHPNAKDSVKPMLAIAGKKIPKGRKWEYEVKWDGIRVLIYKDEKDVKIISRNGGDLTDKFPELLIDDTFDVEQGVFDGEIVMLDPEGRPIFHEVISRMHQKGAQTIERRSRDRPVCCYLFDLLSIDGMDIRRKPLNRRRQWLKTIVRTNEYYRFSENFADGDALFAAIEQKGMEGIMAKDQRSSYESGARSSSWQKIKSRKMDQCLIIGYTHGKGDRKGLFGSLHLAREEDEKLIYMGKVGTGYDHSTLKELNDIVTNVEVTVKPIDVSIEEEQNTVWIEPILKCEIEYASMSSNQTYREPVFKKLV